MAVWPDSRAAVGFSMRVALRGSLGRGPGPLWRKLDRSRSRAQLLLVLGLLGAVLFGCGVAGHGVGTAGVQARAEAVRLHRIDASVVGAIRPDATAVATRYRTGELVWVSWTYPAGHAVVARFELPGPAAAGDALPIWVTDDGAIADAPRGTGAMVLLALGTGAAAWSALTAAVLTIHLLHRRLLRHRTDRFWATGWEAVEPHWSGRLRGRPDRS
ncbi:hypothetical protein E6W39_35760 [Kitasatospora acidiphila]|uniref:Uncharacterized protein n=1 Tax=Kitasatospora acidiphila TaxID=2567942 RepID=A0A540WC38_9ACTN|nr:hypothetical protein [Kitasatospora acidiphila]TQF06573.1 hypothetical protein E6W39_35760 [Kitasatospora acidiphila]